MFARIMPYTSPVPGKAQLLLKQRGDGSVPSDVTFSLLSNTQNYLQADGQWTKNIHTFTICGGEITEKGTLFTIGSDILDPLLIAPSLAQIIVQLPEGERRGVMQLQRDGLLPSTASGQTDDYGSNSVLSTPEPEPVAEATPVVKPEPEVAPVVESQPAPESTKPATPPPAPAAKGKSSPLPKIIGGIVLLLILVGAAWWFMGQHNSPTKPAETDKPAAQEQADSGSCSVASLGSQSELEFVQSCTQQKLDSDQLLSIISAAKDAKQCGVAQRLYAHSAQSGDVKIALAYAAEYDPQKHQENACFNAPDADTAIYWYQTVLQNEPDNAIAKQRLEELSK